jgi:DNA mismatch repair protein MutS
MMEQYHRIKDRNKDSILLFRLGDFYEMFESDAVDASSILNITLTRRNSVPMCGFPYHAADTYISKLIDSGKKIAICEQQSHTDKDGPAGQVSNLKGLVRTGGIVKREVVEVISPGMITDPGLLKNKSNNCIAAIYGDISKGKALIACACLDISTGEFLSIRLPQDDTLDALQNEINSNGIRELLYPESFARSDVFSIFIEKLQKLEPGVIIRAVPDYLFSRSSAEDALKGQFSIASARILEIQEEAGLISCGAVLAYVLENVKQKLPHIRWVAEKKNEDVLVIDNATKKHLELTENQTDGGSRDTLLEILDKTVTAMGGRMLKKRLNNPSRNLDEINRRLYKIRYLFEQPSEIQALRKDLSNILDIERILSRLSVGKGNAREMIGLKNSLQSVDLVRNEIEKVEEFYEETASIPDFSGINSLISSAVVEDPPPSIRDGGIIKNGFDEKLDNFRKINLENREWINRYQGEERGRTGIASLKVKYNKIIGYYIEVTKPNLGSVPSSYIKKQTLVNAERFTTEELEKHEALLMEARENSNALEFSIFEEIRNEVLKSTEDLFAASEIIAVLDVCAALALTAVENGYVMPELVENNVIKITSGRHPVVEVLGEDSFIENDLDLNDTDRRIMILTGPNMAGKSTYLRQAALITIMAHVGSFVPAKSAVIGLVDRVFSRIGSADRLVKGESTFLVEMIETSRILHYASPRRSFDCVGRAGIFAR